LRNTGNTDIYPTQVPWIVEVLKFDWQAFGIKKQAVKCRIWYNLPFSSTNKTFINIYSKTQEEWFANFYIPYTYTTAPAIWDTYTQSWITFTIYDITKKVLLDNTEVKDMIVLHCTYTGNISLNSSFQKWTLTRATWSWDTTFKYNDVDFWYKLIYKIDYANENDREWIQDFIYPEDFKEIQFKFDLFTTSWLLTPEIREFYLQYNFIQNQLWN
jgi:hypothetical protein